MNTKDSMFVLAIVGIVAIVGVIILVMGTKSTNMNREYSDAAGQAARIASPDRVSTIKPVNAHSCNADGVCESNKVSTEIVEAEDVFISDGLDVYQITQLRGPVYIAPLSGQGNAYACIDNNGELYRSGTPCIDPNPLPGMNNCYEVSASSSDWGIQGVYQNNDAYINNVYVNCNSIDDIVISAGFACNPRYWNQTQTVAASVSSPYSVGNLDGWAVTCVGGESQAIVVAKCCAQ